MAIVIQLRFDYGPCERQDSLCRAWLSSTTSRLSSAFVSSRRRTRRAVEQITNRVREIVWPDHVQPSWLSVVQKGLGRGKLSRGTRIAGKKHQTARVGHPFALSCPFVGVIFESFPSENNKVPTTRGLDCTEPLRSFVSYVSIEFFIPSGYCLFFHRVFAFSSTRLPVLGNTKSVIYREIRIPGYSTYRSIGTLDFRLGIIFRESLTYELCFLGW